MSTQWLGNLNNLFTALGLTTVSRMLASAIAFTGGTIDGVTIGGTTPGQGSFTSLGSTGTASFSGLTYVNTAYNAAVIPNGGQGLAIGWNYQTGQGEVDFFSLYPGASNNFNFYQKQSATVVNLVASLGLNGAILPYGATLTGTLGGTYTLAAEQKIAVGQAAPMPESMSARMQFCATAGGVLAVSSTGYLSWGTRIIVMNIGANANTSTNGYFDISQPPSGQTVVVYGNAPARSSTTAGIQLNPWEALYYISPIGYSNTSASGNFAVVGYSTASISVPPHWILICQCNGDNGVYSWLGGEASMKAGQSVDKSSITTFNPGSAAVTPATAAQVQAGTDNAATVTSLALANSSAEQTLTYATTVAWNMAAGYNAKLTLTGNATMGAPTGAIPGRTYVLRVIQDGTGSRTLAWNAAFDWGASGSPTLTTTANKVDLIMLYCVSTSQFLAMVSKGY